MFVSAPKRRRRFSQTLYTLEWLLHPKIHDGPATAPGPAVPEVFLSVHAETFVLILMKRIVAGGVLIQVHIAPHEIVDVDGVLQAPRQCCSKRFWSGLQGRAA